MNGRRALSLISLMFLLTPAVAAVAPVAPGKAPKAPAPSPPVARVGTQPVSRAELDARMQAAVAEFSRRNGNVEIPAGLRDVLQRQVLESMVRVQMLSLEAQRTGTLGTESEADAELRKEPFFNPGGKFDERRFQYMKTTQATAYATAIASIRARLGARRLAQELEDKYKPAEAEARDEARAQLVRASVDHFSLRATDFDGSYPEPRERDVVAYYAAHVGDYHRTARATLKIAFVNVPALTDSARRIPGAQQAWTARMRIVADSLLGVIRRGTSFDEAVDFLGPRSDIVVASDNFPAYWQGTEAQDARLFEPGTLPRVMQEPIPSTEGWLLVRIDDVAPAHVAPIREVASEIRARLRQDSRQHHEEHEARARFAQVRDSLIAPGWPLRYGFADTSSLPVPVPDEAELEAYYRSHAADYSSFDAHSGAIVVTPLAQVHDEVRHHLLAERRQALGRESAEMLMRTWRAGKRDAALEARLHVREMPAMIRGSAIDSGAVARTVADSVWTREAPDGAGFGAYAHGWIVWQALPQVPKVTPSFEQVAGALIFQLRRERADADLAGARALYDAAPTRFARGNTLYLSRITIAPPPPLRVQLTRAEVEKWHHDHIDRYSAPEVIAARHILIAPANATPAADSAALHRAESLLQRIQAGESFADLARQYSDDPATRDKGGDLGSFGRGAMVPVFERAVFALKGGELLAHPLRTELGWHIVQVTAHEAAVVHPLAFVYSAVAADAANDKAVRIARDRADSLLTRVRSWKQLADACRRMGYAPRTFVYRIGDRSGGQEVTAYYDHVAATPPGEICRPAFYAKGDGYWISCVDSVTAPTAPTWEQAQDPALAEYRRGAGRRALVAKKAEIDSMLAGGWSLDSLSSLWGGYQHARDVVPARGIPGLGGGAQVDSLVFGHRGTPPVLAPGAWSGWVELPTGWTNLRVADRQFGTPEQLAARTQSIRMGELERRLARYFDTLRQRYPVTILDARLRDIQLPEPPQGFRD